MCKCLVLQINSLYIKYHFTSEWRNIKLNNYVSSSLFDKQQWIALERKFGMAPLLQLNSSYCNCKFRLLQNWRCSGITQIKTNRGNLPYARSEIVIDEDYFLQMDGNCVFVIAATQNTTKAKLKNEWIIYQRVIGKGIHHASRSITLIAFDKIKA